MTLGPVWLVLTPPRERLPYCREERGRRSRARGTRWSLSPHHTALAARESPATSPAGQAPPRTLRLRAGGAPRVRAHFLRVRRGGRARREPRPRAPSLPPAPPPPRAAAAAAGAQSSSRPATPPPPPQPRPARSRGSRVGAESAPGGEYADPSPAPLTWSTGSHYHPKEGKNKKQKKKTPGLSCASPPFHLLRDPEVPRPRGTQGRHALSPNPHRPWPDGSPSLLVGAPDVRRPLPPPRWDIPRGGTPSVPALECYSRPTCPIQVRGPCAALLGSQLLPSRRRR